MIPSALHPALPGWTVEPCTPQTLSRRGRTTVDHHGMHISADGPNSEHFHLDFPGLAAFDADFAERRVRAAALPETDPSMLDHLLSNQVIPRVLAHRGEFVIHGAAVSDGALSFLIVGPSGAGKSTLSASFHAHGFHLLGDDAIRIIQDSASLEAEAIAPTLRLYPDSIDAIGPPMEGWKPVAMGATKQQALFHDRGGVPGRITVDSILFIDPAPAQAVRISPLSPAESCADLLENSFWLDVLDPETLKAMMVRSARLCASVRAFRIAYPRDYATLDNVRGAILDRLLETEG